MQEDLLYFDPFPPCTSPAVHAEVEVAHAEDRRLETLGVIEGSPTVLKALLHGSRDEHDVLRIAVAAFVEHGDVRLFAFSTVVTTSALRASATEARDSR